ncbi:MAG: dephospho-CoA kinase [Bacteroidaceae bacterium]|nr:dephospho-CoA kinase [Bacteroidaceae bacterium]
MVRLGITGGIGSGKSYVSRLLQEDFGISVYNCDIRARLLMLSDPDLRSQLSSLIEGAYDTQGELDKRRLADYLFASEEHARRVNAIVHPAVRKDLHEWTSMLHYEDVLAVESAILYEAGFDTEVDRVVFVDASQDLRIRRTMARDGLRRRQVLQRITTQRSEEARQRADYILLNDGQANLHAQLTSILDSIKSP